MRSGFVCLVFALAAPSLGCTYVTLEAAHVPNPVLLGPVDRVGGHRAGGEKILAPIEREVSEFASVSTDTKQYGNTVVTTRTTTVLSNGSGHVTHGVLDATEGRADRDVRVDQIPAGSYLLISSGVVMSERWVGLVGRVVEVSRAR